MIQIVRLIFITSIAGGLVWFLGKTIFQGIKTGAIRHTDSTQVCRKDKNPAGFWALIVLFCGFIVLLGTVWAFAVFDALRKMK
jgi:hypothetical protein